MYHALEDQMLASAEIHQKRCEPATTDANHFRDELIPTLQMVTDFG